MFSLQFEHVKFKYIIPPVYERFYPKAIWNADPYETKATCGQCIQAPHKYDEDLKCCTFWPFIPNYIVGKILSSKEVKYKEAQDTLNRHIEMHHWNLPIGLLAPAEYQVEFKKKKDKVFGKKHEFLCPYFSKKNNNCSMWLYRGSVCTSFFCESSYKKKGMSFWHSFENYFSYLEMGLSQEVLVYKDFSPRDLNDQLEYLMVDKKLKITKPKYKKLWKHYDGREKEFYIESAQFVEEMPKSQIQDILGETGVSAKNEMIKNFKALGR